MKKFIVFLLLFSFSFLFAGTRIKNLVKIKGVRDQQLIGYGLVVGLQGTGDGQGALFTVQSIANMLAQMGIKVDSKRLKVKNVAAVMVTASLPAFAESGSNVDVTVSSLGDAKSLQGGTLLMTPLKGPDDNVYVVAQGAVAIGGYGAGGGNRKNHLTTGRIINGGIIERSLASRFVNDGFMTLVLKESDFTTAYKVADSINRFFAEDLATPLDGRDISVKIKSGFAPVKMLAFVEQIEVVPDRRARIVLNERTGTVVMGGDIVVRDVAIAHGNLTITVKSTPFISQPNPFSRGKTVVGKIKNIDVKEEKAKLNLMKGGRIADLVEGLNKLGVSPRDLISILQAMKKAGSIDAEIELM